MSDRAIGSLCILDTKPRRLNEREQRLLEVVADDVVDEIKRRAGKSALASREAAVLLLLARSHD